MKNLKDALEKENNMEINADVLNLLYDFGQLDATERALVMAKAQELVNQYSASRNENK